MSLINPVRVRVAMLLIAGLLPSTSETMAEVPFGAIGSADPGFWSRTCRFKKKAFGQDQCEGFRDGGAIPAVRDEDLVEWLRSLDWHSKGVLVNRKVAGSTSTVPRTIRAITGPKNYALRELGSSSAVVAQIQGSATGAKDEYYNIGGQNTASGWSDDYYLVVDGYISPEQLTPAPVSYQIGRWRLLGIVNNNEIRVVASGGLSTGKLNFCTHAHDKQLQKLGATFTTCERATDLAVATSEDPELARADIGKVLASMRLAATVDASATALDSAAQTALGRFGTRLRPSSFAALRAIIRNEQFDPAWVVCGVGCCSVE